MSHVGPQYESGDSIIFLAMVWAGGGPFRLTEIIQAYDGVNHAIPTAAELDGALNRLLAARLIECTGDRYLVPKPVSRDFDAFRKRTRKDRFATAAAYLKRLPPPTDVPRRVTVSASDHEKAFAEYRKVFEQAARRHRK